jgi:hypothetical protein
MTISSIKRAQSTIYTMRAYGEIGDDVLRSVGAELGWLEIVLGEELRPDADSAPYAPNTDEDFL